MLWSQLVFEIYKDLWRWTEHIGADRLTNPGGCAVSVTEVRTATGASSFTPEGDNGRPELRVNNPEQAEPSARPLDDARVLQKLIKLSHEAGHATSWNAGGWSEFAAARACVFSVEMNSALRWLARSPDESAEPDGLTQVDVAAIVRGVSQHHRDAIWIEENRAWEIGERLLRERGFTAWSAFHDRRERSLHSHAVRIGRVDFEPLDRSLLS
jgi:hypothetical protein